MKRYRGIHYDHRPPSYLGRGPQLGTFTPRLLGCDYLPRLFQGEAEIARIELGSATSDAISVRARPQLQGIRYRIVNEYRTRFRLAFKSSNGPLSLAELVGLIDGSHHPGTPKVGLALCYNELNAHLDDRADFEQFTLVTSVFYPDLCRHYQRVFADWARAPTQCNKGTY